MHKVKSISIITFFILITVTGCSDENNSQSDEIIGEWNLSSRTVSEIPVPLDECEELMVMTIRNDQTLFSQFNTSDIPEKCKTYDFVQLIWEKNSDYLYHAYLTDILVSTFELDGNQLIERIADSDWVNYYERAD